MSEKYTVLIDADTTKAKNKVAALKDELQSQKIDIKFGVSVTGAKKLNELISSLKSIKNSDRSMTIDIKINAASIKKQIQNAISEGVNAGHLGAVSAGKKLTTNTTTKRTATNSQTLKKLVKQYENAAKAVQTLDSKTDLSTLEQKQLQTSKRVMSTARNVITGFAKNNKISVSESVNAFKELDNITDKYITKAEQVKKLSSEASINSLRNEIEKQKTLVDKHAEGKYVDQLNASYLKSKQKFESVEKMATSYRDGSLQMDNSSQNATFLNDVKELNSELKNTKVLATAAAEANKRVVGSDKRIADENKLDNWLSRNNRVYKTSHGQALLALKSKLSDETQTAGEYDQIIKSIKEQQSKALASGAGGKRIGTMLGDAFKNVSTMIGSADIFNGIIRGAQGMYQAVLDVNAAMIDLRKVSDASDKQLDNYFDKAATNAKDLGVSVSEMISSTADFSKLGFNLDESERLSKVATLYKNVGDNLDINQASQSIVSTMKAFDIPAEKVLSIVDKFNEVGNNFAIGSDGIGNALQRSASALAVAKNSLSQSVALITGTNEITQDPEKVGNMWKTVSMRIRGAKTELIEAGEETEGMAESTSELRSLVKTITGFDIMKNAKEFKSTYDIVVGIGEVFKDLQDIDQAVLLEKLAGKNRGSQLADAFKNVERIKEAYATAEDSSGSAMKEQSEYEKGIGYSLDRLKASAQEISNNALSSDFLKGAIDSANTLLEVLNSIGSALGAGGTIGALLGGFLGNKTGLGGEKCYPSYFVIVGCPVRSTNEIVFMMN